MNVFLRKFQAEDVPHKVRWINAPENNQYLHYDLPLIEDKTFLWWETVKDIDTRLDMTILLDGIPVGVAGLLQIDWECESAELYITVGAQEAKRKGVATEAIRQLLEIAFTNLGLHRIYLTTETENVAACRTYEKVGFRMEGCLRDCLRNREKKFVSLYAYSILRNEFEARYGNY